MTSLFIIYIIFRFFNVILTVHPHCIFALSPTIWSLIHYSFIRPRYFFVRERYTVRVIRWIIRVKSNDIAFHNLVSIVIFYMVKETIRVGVHDLTFVTLYR